MGEIPEWYALLRAAKFMGVSPWALAERPAIWMQWALAAEGAEAKAQSERSKHKR